MELPAYVVPGMADWSITLPLGYGRRMAGVIGRETGFDVYPLRTSGAMGFVVGAKVTKTGKTHPLATTQEQWTVAEHHLKGEAVMERAIVRVGTLRVF